MTAATDVEYRSVPFAIHIDNGVINVRPKERTNQLRTMNFDGHFITYMRCSKLGLWPERPHCAALA